MVDIQHPRMLADWSESKPWEALEDLPVALVLLDGGANVVEFNRAAGQLLRAHDVGLMRRGSPFMTLVGPTVRQFIAWYADRSEEALKTELRVGATTLPVRLAKSTFTPSRGCTVLAITPEEVSNVAPLHEFAFDVSDSGLFVTSSAGNVRVANSALSQILAVASADVVGSHWKDLFLPGLSPAQVDEIDVELVEHGCWSGAVVVAVPARGDRILDLKLQLRKHKSTAPFDRVTGAVDKTVVGTVADITDHTSMEEMLKEQARLDSLTGLLNRAGFLEALQERFTEAERSGTGLTMMYLDLDNFKSLNDQFGHRFGDMLLDSFAKRLRGALKSTDLVGRVGGDEFTVLFDPALAPATLANVVTKLQNRLLQDYQLDELNYTCSASIGSAEYPWDASTCDELLEFADHAMYQAKTGGRNRHERFDRKEFRRWADKELMLKLIETGIDGMEFVPYYQPIFNPGSGALSSAEALVRWIHPDGGAVRLPADFLPLVEGLQAGVHMGIRMLDQVLVHMRSFTETVAPVSISVNLSAAQLRSEQLVQHVEMLAERFPNEISRLTIELVESAFYDGDPVIAKNLSRLVAMGASLALDDFGTGHSSLLSLRAHEFTQLKIDQRFLAAASTGRREDVVVFESMLDLSQNLGMETVAEGVETTAQLDYLRKLNCDSAQGFLLARPMPKEDFRALLAKQAVAP